MVFIITSTIIATILTILIIFGIYKLFKSGIIKLPAKNKPKVKKGIEVEEKETDELIRFIPYVVYSDNTREQISKPLNAHDLDIFLADYISENFK